MSERWQVYKFGGSSLGTSGRLPKVLELVAAAPRPLALVVSALGDSTDWLILAARSAEVGNISQARRELTQVRDLANATARAVLNSQGQKGVKHDLDEILTPVERLLSGIELTRECSARTLDSIVSVGERIGRQFKGDNETTIAHGEFLTSSDEGTCRSEGRRGCAATSQCGDTGHSQRAGRWATTCRGEGRWATVASTNRRRRGEQRRNPVP